MPLTREEISTRIGKEHEQLKQEMEKLYQMIDAEIPVGKFPRWRMDFLFELRDFQNCLLKHFDLEEEGGFMRDVLQMAPQKQNAVNQLRNDHRNIASEIEAIIVDLKALTEMEIVAYNQIRSRVEDVFTLLTNHKTVEADLIISTYFQDEGLGD